MTALVCGAVLPGLLIAWAAGFFVRRYAPRLGFVDVPAPRKIHTRPIALGGGVAIWLGVVVPLAVGQAVLSLTQAGVFPPELWPDIARPHIAGLIEQVARLWMLVAAGTVLLGLGIVDDFRTLSWQLRLCVQVAIAALLVLAWEGWRLTIFLEWPLLTGTLSVIWIVWLVNAFNMLDNMDGLAAGVALIASGLLAAVLLNVPAQAATGPQLFVAGLLLLLVGALGGFLWHNAWPARLFMGDGGAYFIGLLIGATTLTATFTSEHLPRHAILTPLFVLAVPLYDTASVLYIRLRQRRSIVEGDNSHFSHRLVKIGLSQRSAVATIYLAALTCGMAALPLHEIDGRAALLLLGMVVCLLAIIALLETAGRR